MNNKQLKKSLEDLNIKIFDMLRLLDPSKTGKYMSFLIKEFRKKHKQEGFTNYSPLLNEENYLDRIRKKCKNELEDRLVEYIIDLLSDTNVTNLQVFHELLEKGKIKENDIQKYNSFEDVEKAIVEYEENNHEGNIHEYQEIYKDDRWYIVKPLSYYTAKIYGASTKWCTSSRETPKQFYEYSKEGILLYVIDRANNKKWAVHWAIWKGQKEEMSWWDSKDSRIDSIQVDIPFGIMNEVKNHLYKEEKPNITYFSDESLINLKKLLKLEKKNKESRQFENLMQDVHGENFNIDIGGTWDIDQYTGTTYTKPVQFDVDGIINKTLEYNYTMKAIDKGGIPE
mgnify:CR=1 FL=1